MYCKKNKSRKSQLVKSVNKFTNPRKNKSSKYVIKFNIRKSIPKL